MARWMMAHADLYEGWLAGKSQEEPWSGTPVRFAGAAAQAVQPVPVGFEDCSRGRPVGQCTVTGI